MGHVGRVDFCLINMAHDPKTVRVALVPVKLCYFPKHDMVKKRKTIYRVMKQQKQTKERYIEYRNIHTNVMLSTLFYCLCF